MRRRVYDLAALTRKEVKVFLDDKRVPINNFQTYTSLYTENDPIVEKCAESSVNGDRWNIIVTSNKRRVSHTS